MWVSYKHTGIEKGYLVTRIDEIWQYKYTRYNFTTRQSELFADYINSFLQLKQEASERPSECGNDDVAKLEQLEVIEDIVLNKNNIEQNPVAKFCLISFWGKFGQRTNLSSIEIIRNPQRLAELLSSPEYEVTRRENQVYEVTRILPINDEVIYSMFRGI